jgi:hypothetical protein
MSCSLSDLETCGDSAAQQEGQPSLVGHPLLPHLGLPDDFGYRLRRFCFLVAFAQVVRAAITIALTSTGSRAEVVKPSEAGASRGPAAFA